MNIRSVGIMFVVFAMIMTAGCSSKVVPPGSAVIVLKSGGETEIVREGTYVAWGRDRVYFVDTKLKSFTESMKILCDDKVNMSVDVKWVGSFDISKDNINVIKEKVPAVEINGDTKGYQLSLSKFYNIAIKDIVRANSRAIVSPYKTDVIPEERVAIEKSIRKLVIARLKELKYPVKTSDVLVSNLDFDESVTATRKKIKQAELADQEKAAIAKATLAQAKRDAEIAREQGKATVEKAKAESKANKILTKSLTPQILALRQWEAMERIGAGTNNELIVLPYNALGTNVQTSAVNRRSIRAQ